MNHEWMNEVEKKKKESTIFWLVQGNERGRNGRDRRCHRRRHERGGLPAEGDEGWWRMMSFSVSIDVFAL